MTIHPHTPDHSVHVHLYNGSAHSIHTHGPCAGGCKTLNARTTQPQPAAAVVSSRALPRRAARTAAAGAQVQSSAAGTYILDAIAASPGFHTTLAIATGQTVAAAGVIQPADGSCQFSGDGYCREPGDCAVGTDADCGDSGRTAWGEGAGFTVAERGSLSLTAFAIAGDLSVAGGGELTLDSCLLAEGLAVAVAADGTADLTDVVFGNQAREHTARGTGRRCYSPF